MNIVVQTQKPADILEQIESILWDNALSPRANSKIASDIAKILDSQDNRKKVALEYINKYDADLYQFLWEPLHSDREILRAVIQKKPEIFQTLEKHYQKDIEFLEIYFRSLLNRNKSFLSLFFELEKLRSDKKIFQHMEEYLREYNFSPENYFQKDICELYFSYYSDFLMLVNFGFFDLKSGQIRLPEDFIARLKHTWDETAKVIPLSEKLLSFLALTGKKIPEALHRIIGQISTKIEIKKTKDDTENTGEEENQWKEKKTESVLKNEDYAWETQENYLDVYSPVSYGGYTYISESNGEVHKIESDAIKHMKQACLERFLSFRNLLKDLDLLFLLEKHSSKIMLATDVSFYSGEGMTDARVLKFLNSVAKNIWVPEKTFQDPETQEPEIGCFETLDGAKFEFHEIHETGKVGTHFSYPLAEKGEYSIVELALKAQGKIIPPYFEISLSKWD